MARQSPEMDFRGRVFLAPLTKGGNLPFRRLLLQHGCTVTMGEMAYAYQVVRRSKSELALLRKHPDESCFGAQIAASKAPDAIVAGKAAAERGALWVDLNCGCPIHDVVKRGMGATLLQRPAHLGKLVEEMVKGIPVPVSVKIRLGWTEGEQNASEVARICQESGAAALTVHGRTREQRYSRAADWAAIARIAAERSIPVIGNGDLLTWYETHERWQQSGVASVMVGRGALIKPWLFREITEKQAWEPTASERLAVYFDLAQKMKLHFRDDEKGKERAMRFLPWHFEWFCRYRPLSAQRWVEASKTHPLLQTRMPDDETDLSVLELLLRDGRPELHQKLALLLWESPDAAVAEERALALAAEMPPVAGGAGEMATAHG
ncbi:MAG: tRNA-dihydrouridine synthase family protein [Planctomycetes bacterium]|nr:tRNA-dihydrouridine synthase family protein [Planctomycetota bacterium]